MHSNKNLSETFITFLTTGGTFDKVYFDAKSEFYIGDPMIDSILEEANISFQYEVISILKKDSLDINDSDREQIRKAVLESSNNLIIITHGTDAMVETANCLSGINNKTIVLVGAMQPARMRLSDASYNIGVATTAVQLLPTGVHLAMNGQIFDPAKTRKNWQKGRFESA
ncbi:MAG: L-asparaginase [Gammaproteobacteria bacterium]|jgi:L-asparaginase